MLGNNHDRLIVAPARAARRRSAATLTSRFPTAARRMRSERTGSWKFSHHVASGPVSDCSAPAYWSGTATLDSNVGTVGVGNYFTGVAAGMYGEVGWNLVDALGVPALRPGLNAASTVGVGPVKGWSVAFYAGFGGYGVAHYLPLDGTVFHDSRSVDSEPLVGTGTVGIAVRHRGSVLSLAQTYFTDMFETEQENAEFGTLSLSWYF